MTTPGTATGPSARGAAPAAQVLPVDARFRAQPASTGVHQWSASVLAALPAQGVRPVEIVPTAGSGPRGHAWEQLVLPTRVRAAGADLPLLSPCNWGPLAVGHQAVVLHDVAPLVVPEHFSRAYVAMARVQLPLLVRRVARVLTVSQSSREDILRLLPVSEDRVVVVGGGTRVLPPPDPAVAARLPERFFAFVGAHDARKNLAFLLELWPQVHARTGASLVVTRRPSMRTNVDSGTADAPWYVELVDPDDAALAAVLTGARALLWPSRYEGYGMPLLEAYAVGTGVVTSDTGVARELVVAGDAVLPLDRDAWAEAIVARATEPDPPERAAARQETAGRYGFDAVARRVLDALRSV